MGNRGFLLPLVVAPCAHFMNGMTKSIYQNLFDKTLVQCQLNFAGLESLGGGPFGCPSERAVKT